MEYGITYMHDGVKRRDVVTFDSAAMTDDGTGDMAATAKYLAQQRARESVRPIFTGVRVVVVDDAFRALPTIGDAP